MDPYSYPGTNVLKNIPGILDEGALRELEYVQTAARIVELRQNPIQGKFDLDHLKAIHAHIFQDMYDWAGQTRTVGISKSSTHFANPAFIEGEARKLSTGLAKEKNLHGLEKPQFVDRLAHYYAEWNALHPFREGNGRATREFIGQLAREAGYELNQSRIDNSRDQWNEASRRSFVGDLSQVKQILAEAIQPARVVAFENLPRVEAVAKFPELAGAYAALHLAEQQVAKQLGSAGKDVLKDVRQGLATKIAQGEIPRVQVAQTKEVSAAPNEKNQGGDLDR